MNANPVIVELNSLLLIDQRHVALNTVVGRRDRTDDMGVDGLIMALNAVLNMVLRIRSVVRRMRIVAGRASQSARGLDAAFASEHADGLKADQIGGVFAELLFGHAARQSVAIAAELDFRLAIPRFEPDRVGRWIRVATREPRMLAPRAMTLLTVHVGNQIVNLPVANGRRGRVAMNAACQCDATNRVTIHLHCIGGLLVLMTDGDVEAIIGVAGDAVFNAFGFSLCIGEQRQKGLRVVPGAKDKWQRKRFDFFVASQLCQ